MRQVRLEVNLDVPDDMTDDEAVNRTMAALEWAPAFEGANEDKSIRVQSVASISPKPVRRVK